MRLSRLGTDSSLPPDHQGFRGRVRVGLIDPRGGSAEQLPAHQTDRGSGSLLKQATRASASSSSIRLTLPNCTPRLW